jgi:hypothetical protein
MILLRLLSILAGGLILIVPPLFLFGGTSGPEYFDGKTVVAALAGLTLVAFTFFFIGFAGDRMRKSAPLRTLGGLLLAVPFAGSAAMLLRAAQVELLWLSGLLLCVTVVLFVAFVFPASGSRKHRPMRRREPREPKLLPFGPR